MRKFFSNGIANLAEMHFQFRLYGLFCTQYNISIFMTDSKWKMFISLLIEGKYCNLNIKGDRSLDEVCKHVQTLKRSLAHLFPILCQMAANEVY